MFCLFHSKNDSFTSEEESQQIKEVNDTFNDKQIPTTMWETLVNSPH